MNVAVAGAGRIALEHFGALRALGTPRLVACDLSPAAAQLAAERFDLDAWYVDYDEMLRREQPGFVHITTPASTHVALARKALEAGAHVFVEKPIAVEYSDWLVLRDLAVEQERWLIEDYSYQFSPPVLEVLRLIEAGLFGEVVHASIRVCLDIHAGDSPFSDPNLPHPSLAHPGGAVSDLLTHLASLCWLFAGPHEETHPIWEKRNPDSLSPYDEMRALVKTEKATADLVFTGSGLPDGFFVMVQGTQMRAEMNLFENTLRVDRVWPGPSPLTPFWNGFRAGWSEASSGTRSLWSKLAGRPGASEGVWRLITLAHTALRRGGSQPIGLDQIDDVNRLVRDILRNCVAS